MLVETPRATILCVEDEAAIAEFYDREFSKFACVIVVGTVKEGCAAVDSVRFDMAVLDVILPDGSGVEVARRLRLVQDDVPIYVISALHEHDARKEFAGIDNVTFHEKVLIVKAIRRRLGV